MKNVNLKYRFNQLENTKIHQLFVYDTVTAVGDFNWETWEYDESKTSANYFVNQLQNIAEDEEIEIHINSYGGDVKEGVAIYNNLKRHKANKTCYVDGVAYSIASVICMACDKIIMGLGTSMLIHNMWTTTSGNAAQLRKAADDLDILMQSNRQIYLERAKNLTEQKLIEMLDNETFLTPEQCKEYGFCDEIGVMEINNTLLEQSSFKRMQQLQLEIKNQKSFKEEIKEFLKEDPQIKNEDETQKNIIQTKALKIMSAFLNAKNNESEE